MKKYAPKVKTGFRLIVFLFLFAVRIAYSQTYQWANKIGASGDQIGDRCYIDQTSGKIFTVGHFKGTVDFDPGVGVSSLTAGSGYNGYVASYSSSGALIWAKSFYSASGESYITGVVADASLNVYISGYYKSQMDVDPGINETSITTGGQQMDGFIVKLNSSGDLVWYKTIGSSADERIQDIALDANNNVVVVGHCNAASLDIDPGPGVVTLTGLATNSFGSGPNTFGFVLKLDNSGNYINNYQKANNSNGSRKTEIFFTRVKVNTSNDIYVSGYRHYDDFYGSSEDYKCANLLKLNGSNFAVLRSVDFYANQNNSTAPYFTSVITDLEVDANDNYYVVGYFNYNIHVGSVLLSSTNLNIDKGWVGKYNSAGVAQWGKGIYLNNIPLCADLDNSGNLYVGGYYSGTNDFDPASGLTSNSTAIGGNDAYLLKLNNNGGFTGNIQKLSGLNNEFISDVALHKSSGDFVITGALTSANVDFNPGAGVNTLSTTDLNDAFLAKYTPCSMPLPPVNTTPVGDLSICGGASTTLTVANQSGATFGWYANANAGLQTSAGLTKVVNPATTTSYFVQATNSCGTSARTEIIVSAVGSAVTPTLVSSTNSPSTVCQGNSVTFTTAQTNGGTPTYQWYNNNVSIPGQNGASMVTTALPAGSNSIKCKMISNAACRTVDSVFSNSISITVTASAIPAINISTAQTTICNGTSATFTAAASQGGSTPLYQWKVNNTNQGANSSNNTFTSSNLSNNAQVSCVLTSNAGCLTNAVAQSNVLTMTVNTNLVPTVNISATQTTICTGSSVTFNALVTNGGTNPTYQWKLNNTNISGATSSSYTTTTLTNGASITCDIVSNASCAMPASVTSNAIVISVVSSVVPTIGISATQTNICPGATVNFSSIQTNGGSNPTYQWKLNNANINGATASTYSSNSLTNGDVITCAMTSNNSCASPSNTTSNALTINITGTVTPSVVVSTQQTSICAGDSLNLIAVASNAGLSPSYQWKKNNQNISGATSASYSTTSAANGDVYYCLITSSDPCASPTTASSNSITVNVSSSVIASISITSTSSSICSGSNVTFNAIAVNGGTNPGYQWKVNGNNVGSNANSYSSTNINNGDIVTCELSSNVTCLNLQSTLTSNALTMVVNNTTVPSASIQTTQNAICASDTLLLNVEAINFGDGGASYQWKINGSDIGVNNDSIALDSLSNGDIITCILTSSETCVSPSTVSVSYTASVLSSVANTNTVAASSIDICQGANVNYSSTVSGTASSTSYQWYVNSSMVNGATYSSYTNFPADNDEVFCIISSISACGSTVFDTSNVITMNVGATGQAAYIYINTPNTSICSTDTITFSSNSYNTGNSPVYNWLVNGISVGNNTPEFVTGNLNSGDEIKCILSSSDGCLTNGVDTSSAIIIGVTQTVTPQMNLTVDDSIICSGQTVTFNNTYSGGGSNPIVQWYLVHNGIVPFTAGNSYVSNSLVDKDTIVCVLVNNDYCAIPNYSIGQIAMSVGIDTTVTYFNGTYTATMSGASYQWIDCGIGGQPIPGETSQSFTPNLSGNYAVIIDIGSCSDTSTCQPIVITYNNEMENNEFNIFPSPASSDLTIVNLVATNLMVELVDLTGKVVYSERTSLAKTVIDISNLSNGFYFCRLVAENSIYTQKIIINH